MRLIIVLIYMVLCFTGSVQFHLWPQVTYLWESSAEISKLFLHPHGMRYLLVYPIFKVADLLGISYDYLFSIVTPILLGITAHCIIKAINSQKILSAWNQQVLFIIIFIGLVLLSFFMNGRILFAITGASILLYLYMNWHNINLLKRVILFSLSLLLSSVSSGTIFITITSFTIFVVYKNLDYRAFYWRDMLLLFFVAGVGWALLPLLKILIMKNINYYGSVIAMLSHGLGNFFLRVDFSILVLSLLLLIILGLINILFMARYKSIRIPLGFIIISLFGGLFGISTMMMMIPAIMLIICIWILNVNAFLIQVKDNK